MKNTLQRAWASVVLSAAGDSLFSVTSAHSPNVLTVDGHTAIVAGKRFHRGNRRIRVGLAGPGRAFGYESLIDGSPSPVTAVTRERALLLVLPRDPFEQLFNGEDAVSHVFLDVIQREIVATVRQTLRTHARVAASD